MTTEPGLFEQIKMAILEGNTHRLKFGGIGEVAVERTKTICADFEQRLAEAEKEKAQLADYLQTITARCAEDTARIGQLECVVAELASFDTYETEYDGQMLNICHFCHYNSLSGGHETNCVFVRASSLIPPPSLSAESVAEPIKCPHCPKTFNTEQSRKQHIAAKHKMITAGQPETGQPDDLPNKAEIYAQWCKELIAALKRLSFAAQTSGGTAGRDEELCAAIAQAEKAMSLSATNRAYEAAEQPAQEAEPVAQLAYGEQNRDPRDGPRLISWNDMPAGTYALYTHPAPQEARAGVADIKAILEIVDQLETYCPAADEYKGQFIHKGWAKQLRAIIDRAAPSRQEG